METGISDGGDGLETIIRSLGDSTWRDDFPRIISRYSPEVAHYVVHTLAYQIEHLDADLETSLETLGTPRVIDATEKFYQKTGISSVPAYVNMRRIQEGVKGVDKLCDFLERDDVQEALQRVTEEWFAMSTSERVFAFETLLIAEKKGKLDQFIDWANRSSGFRWFDLWKLAGKDFAALPAIMQVADRVEDKKAYWVRVMDNSDFRSRDSGRGLHYVLSLDHIDHYQISLDTLFSDSTDQNGAESHALKLALHGNIPAGRTWRDSAKYNAFIKDLLRDYVSNMDIDLSRVLLFERKVDSKSFHPVYNISVDFRHSGYDIEPLEFFVKFFSDSEDGKLLHDRELMASSYLHRKGLPVLLPKSRHLDANVAHDNSDAETCFRDGSKNRYTLALAYEFADAVPLIDSIKERLGPNSPYGSWTRREMHHQLGATEKRILTRAVNLQKQGVNDPLAGLTAEDYDISTSQFAEAVGNIIRVVGELEQDHLDTLLKECEPSLRFLRQLHGLNVDEFSRETGIEKFSYDYLIMESLPETAEGVDLGEYVLTNVMPRLRELCAVRANITVAHGDFHSGQISVQRGNGQVNDNPGGKYLFSDTEFSGIRLKTDDVYRIAYDRKIQSFLEQERTYGSFEMEGTPYLEGFHPDTPTTRHFDSGVATAFREAYLSRAADISGYSTNSELWQEMLSLSVVVNSLVYLGHIQQKNSSGGSVNTNSSRSHYGLLTEHLQRLVGQKSLSSHVAEGLLQRVDACYAFRNVKI